MNEENLLSIYEFLGGEDIVGPKDVYLSKMQDEEVAKKFYNDFSSDLGGNEAGFLSHIGVSGKVDKVEEVEEVEEVEVAEEDGEGGQDGRDQPLHRGPDGAEVFHHHRRLHPAYSI